MAGVRLRPQVMCHVSDLKSRAMPTWAEILLATTVFQDAFEKLVATQCSYSRGTFVNFVSSN